MDIAKNSVSLNPSSLFVIPQQMGKGLAMLNPYCVNQKRVNLRVH
ncbi:MAG: hypothetical protein RLZZ507_1660 [Cyanobacteriota bacterium]|jgi:hypothetical protein